MTTVRSEKASATRLFCSTSTIESPEFAQLQQHRGERLDDHRREPFGRLVHQQHRRVGEERACDREHLLLAAGELVAHVGEPLRQAREQLEHARLRPVTRPRGDLEVLVHRQRGKDLALLRHIAEAGERAGIDRHARDALSGEQDVALMQAGVAHDGGKERGLADAVAPDDADVLAGCERKLDVFEHHGLAVARRHALEFERASHDATCPR